MVVILDIRYALMKEEKVMLRHMLADCLEVVKYMGLRMI
jgi:hypothetical protein